MMSVNSYSKLKKFLIFIIIFSLFLTCDKKKEFYFPYAKVDLQLHLYTDLSDLGNGGTKIINDEYCGLGGILLYRVDEYNFFAFDMACVHEISQNCIIQKDEAFNIFYKCPCCGSEYTLDGYSTNGNFVSKGPAEWPLKQYYAYINGDFLIIRN